MVTIIRHQIYNPLDGKDYKELFDVRLISTDEKPSAPNGSTCLEMDTGKRYIYDQEGATWWEVTSAAVIISALGVLF